jgi:hypothetical protein
MRSHPQLKIRNLPLKMEHVRYEPHRGLGFNVKEHLRGVVWLGVDFG